jgi:protein-S-isoprenylcysteine O-methyltransferase Ste14
MRSSNSKRNKMKQISGKILYGFLFVIVLPVCLVIWEKKLDDVIRGFPTIISPVIGSLLMVSGFVIMFCGWRAIIRYGRGLPMNAFPPERLVSRDIYAIIPDPIYSGFTMLVAGYAIFTGSAAGLWIVTPTVALCSAAIVIGYERIDMKNRFGTNSWQTIICLPPAEDRPPTWSERISAYLLVYLPWFILYEAVIFLGPMPDAIDTYFNFERSISVIEWTELIYAFTYLFVIMVPLLVKRRIDLRNFMLMGIWGIVIGLLCFLFLPFKATPRPFIPTTDLGQILMMERSMDGPAGAFPAFHVLWALFSAWLYARTFKNASLWYFVAGIISLSCITTGMHSILDISGAVFVFITVRKRQFIWCKTLQLTEGLANSWHEWRVGRVRIINHGFYVGIGGFTGVTMAAHLAGPEQIWYVLLVSFSSLVGAGLWGQALEGSSKLSRPFGFYGGLFGGCLGLSFSIVIGADGWQLAGAFAVAGPYVQAIGRLRCLVQGCCHGRECSYSQGIVVSHDCSRVIYLSHLGNRPIYPTQLYSILYNIVLGALLVRVWILSAPMPVVIGGYLLLGGIGRFIEESYRGESQTIRIGGLAVYQWLALACVPIGAVIMTFSGNPCTLQIEPMPWLFLSAGAFGLIVAFAMGVDFPESQRRFSRLA